MHLGFPWKLHPTTSAGDKSWRLGVVRAKGHARKQLVLHKGPTHHDVVPACDSAAALAENEGPKWVYSVSELQHSEPPGSNSPALVSG